MVRSDGRPMRGSRLEEAPSGTPPSVWIAALATLALGIATVPVSRLSVLAIRRSVEYRMPDFGPAGLPLQVLIAALLITAAAGLLLRRQWSWILGLIGLLGGVAYYARLLVPTYLYLRWEHPAASEIAVAVGLYQGIPLVTFCAALVLYASPAVRGHLGRSSYRHAPSRAAALNRLVESMKRRIQRISPHPAAIVMAVVYAILSLLFVPLLLLAEPEEGETPIPKVLALFFPVLYAVLGYLGTALMAVLYNLAAGWVGGIEITFDDPRPERSHARVRRAPAGGASQAEPPDAEG